MKWLAWAVLGARSHKIPHSHTKQEGSKIRGSGHHGNNLVELYGQPRAKNLEGNGHFGDDRGLGNYRTLRVFTAKADASSNRTDQSQVDPKRTFITIDLYIVSQKV